MPAHPRSAPRRRDVGGRPAVSRDEIVAISGAGRSTVDCWYAQRGENGHPEPVARIDRADYFDEATWRDWHAGHLAAKKAGVLPVDRTGDPAELVPTAEVSRMLGYARPGVIIDYLTKHPGYFPRPDDEELTPAGRVRRFWYRRTVWEWAEQRGLRTSGRRPPRT